MFPRTQICCVLDTIELWCISANLGKDEHHSIIRLAERETLHASLLFYVRLPREHETTVHLPAICVSKMYVILEA